MRTALMLLATLACIATANADSGDRRKITDNRRNVIGDVYDPGHGRRLQLRDNRGRIVGYIERDGTLTDPRRRISARHNRIWSPDARSGSHQEI